MKAHALDQKIEAFARRTSRALQLDGICHAGGFEEHQHFLGFVRIHARRDLRPRSGSSLRCLDYLQLILNT